MCQQHIASKVISYPFPFLYILGMPSRDSPSLRFIDKNTKAQGRDVTCPSGMVLEPPPLAQAFFSL